MNNTTTFDQMEEGRSGSILPHLPTIIWQRKWLFLAPAVIGLIIGIAAAFLLPVTYQSKAVLLVEAPLLPQDVAGDVGASEVIDQRLARIRQQVLSRPALIEIIQRNGLYQTELRIKTLSEVIEKMRRTIQIAPVTADIEAAGGGRKSTIAFSISFDYSDPVKAQAVAQALFEQVLQLNASTQSAQASTTVQFLSDQADSLLADINRLEGTISQIKASNGYVLSSPGGTIAGTTMGYDAQITQIEQSNNQLRAQKQLSNTQDKRDPIVQQAEAALAAAQATYADSHPDVILAKQRLAEAKALAKDRANDVPSEMIDQQIALNNRQIAALRSAKGSAEGMINAQMRAPAVQEQVSQLQEKLTGLNEQYRKVAIQLSAARAGKKADDEQQGERLTPVDPPVVADQPISPNRPLLISSGLIVGLGIGLFLILALEVIFRPIRHVGMIAEVTGEPPLVVIPTIFAPGERKGGLFSGFRSSGKGKPDDDDDD